MRPCYWIVIFCLILFGDAYAQPAWKKFDTKSSGLALQMNWMQLSDNHFSPLRYNGPGTELNILSVRYYGDMRRYFNLGAKAGYLWNNNGFNSMCLQPEVGAGLTFLADNLSSANALSFLGGGINATSRIYRFLNEDPDHIHWATSYALEFHYILDVEISENRKALMEIKLPVAGMISRPSADDYYTFQLPGFSEHMKRIHKDSGFATWDKMQALNMQVVMDLSRSRRSSVSLGYELDLARFTEPSPAVYFTNSLFLRIFFDVFVIW